MTDTFMGNLWLAVTSQCQGFARKGLSNLYVAVYHKQIVACIHTGRVCFLHWQLSIIIIILFNTAVAFNMGPRSLYVRLYFSHISCLRLIFYTRFMKDVFCSVKCCRAGDMRVVSFLHDIQEKKRTANLGHSATSAAVFLSVRKKGNLLHSLKKKGMFGCSNQVAPKGLK